MGYSLSLIRKLKLLKWADDESQYIIFFGPCRVCKVEVCA